MRSLYTVAYPELSAADSEFIEGFRQKYDEPYRDVVAAHFTIVFGIQDVSDQEYAHHVCSVAASSSKIPFMCRYAMLGADDADETAYVFLVPDEGYSSVSLLRDHIYTGPLERFHRLDIPYVPHITIGTLQDRRQVKALCDELNGSGLAISGTLSQLTVGALHEGKFVNQFAVKLGAA